MTAPAFLRQLEAERQLLGLDRVLAVLWWVGREDPSLGMTARDICAVVEAAGHPKQNASRLEGQLAADRRTSQAGGGAWRLRPQTRRELDAEYAFALEPARPGPSDSVLPRQLFTNTRGYIERVVKQINKTYDDECWDACAVMCRRLLETLIIEVYEHRQQADQIKGRDGHFFMFNDLIAHIQADRAINLGRNATQGLKDHKALGDQSAHNRRFNAERNDIDRLRNGLRVAAEELLHLAGLRRATDTSAA
jgi:hypothetical protein